MVFLWPKSCNFYSFRLFFDPTGSYTRVFTVEKSYLTKIPFLHIIIGFSYFLLVEPRKRASSYTSLVRSRNQLSETCERYEKRIRETDNRIEGRS